MMVTDKIDGYRGRIYEELLRDAYDAMTTTEKNPRGVWRRAEDVEVLDLRRVLRSKKDEEK